MPELGLFPLSIVLLPTERVPLHIFEPRYKELIGECLALDREFGLLLADEEDVREVGCRAAVIEVLERFEDGRLNIVIEGRKRFRVVRHTAGRSFSTAEVEPVEDEPGAADPETVERALALFRQLGEIVGADVDEPEPAVPQLSFALAARVDFGADEKQELLESRSEPERLALVVRLLERAVAAMAAAEEVRRRAAGNGEVSPPGGG